SGSRWPHSPSRLTRSIPLLFPRTRPGRRLTPPHRRSRADPQPPPSGAAVGPRLAPVIHPQSASPIRVLHPRGGSRRSGVCGLRPQAARASGHGFRAGETAGHAGTSTGAIASTRYSRIPIDCYSLLADPPRAVLPRRRRELFLQWQSRPPSTAPPSPSSGTSCRANPWRRWSPVVCDNDQVAPPVHGDMRHPIHGLLWSEERGGRGSLAMSGGGPQATNFNRTGHGSFVHPPTGTAGRSSPLTKERGSYCRSVVPNLGCCFSGW
ncbi:unnamed protein product, partial [Urochloa humidicola]